MKRLSFILSILICLQFNLFAQPAEIIWSEDWEGGIGNWFASNGVWEVGIPMAGPANAYSGQNCAGTGLTGNYPAYANTRLTSPISPVIVLPSVAPGEKLLLEFWHFYIMTPDAEVVVQISVNNGIWQTVAGPFIRVSDTWTRFIVDLSAFADSSIRLGFLFTSGGNIERGWYVDDIKIIKKQLIFNNPEDFESGIGDWYTDAGVWEVGIPGTGPATTHSGEYCAGTAVYNDSYPVYTSSRMISPEIKIIPEQSEIPVLYFWHFFIMASEASGEVQVSVNNGTWQTVGGPFTGVSDVWTQYIVDLSSFADSSIRLGFLFSSGGWIERGWYIDDIRIEGLQSTVVVNVDNDLSVQWLEPASNQICGTLNEQPVTIWIENLGMNPVSGFDAGYSVDDGSRYTTETVFQTIEPGAGLEYTFFTKADMSDMDSFRCTAFVDIPYDIDPANNFTSVTVHNDRMIIDIQTTDTECNKTTGIAEILSISGREGPFRINWTSGDQDMIAENLGSGTYLVTITDGAMCTWTKSVVINDIGAPDYSVISSDINDISCYGMKDGSIYIYPTGGMPPYSYRWSTGETTQDITGLSKGQYDVIIKDASGCAKTHSFMITEPPPVSIRSVVTDANCGESNGSAEILVSGGTQPYNYAWSSGHFSSTVSGLPGGIYSVIVMDKNDCTDSTLVSVNELNAPGFIVESITPASCGLNDGGINLTPGDENYQYTYTWSDGRTSQDVQNLPGGTYSVSVSLENGSCATNQIIQIPVIPPPPSSICMVTVDSITDANIVIMNQPDHPEVITSYNIYKLAKTGDYQYMDSEDPAMSNTEADAASNTEVTSYRYRVTLVDSCGNESEPGPFHETMHVVATPDYNLTRANIFWNSYKGVEYYFFKILRYSTLKGLEVMDTVPRTSDMDFYTYTDLNPPVNDTVYYVIEIELAEPCISNLKTESHNTVRSNKSKKQTYWPENVDHLGSIRQLNVFPNPNKGSFRVSLETVSSQDVILGVFDSQGRMINHIQYYDINGQFEDFIEMHGISPGIYHLQMLVSDGMMSRSFVVE